jgi:GNAT superfamily N-acetyltransferase
MSVDPQRLNPSSVLSGLVLRAASAAEVVDLRHAVLRAGLPRATAQFPGDDSADTRHFVAEVRRQVIGCLSFMHSDMEGRPAWQLRGMAVAEEYRRLGIGGRLLKFAEDQVLRDSPGRLLWCNARKPAVAFYRRHGWRIISEEFVIPTAGPHFRMAKEP